MRVEGMERYEGLAHNDEDDDIFSFTTSAWKVLRCSCLRVLVHYCSMLHVTFCSPSGINQTTTAAVQSREMHQSYKKIME